MNEKTLFFNMFSDYEPPETLKSALSQAVIVAADLDPVRRRAEVALYSDSYIPQRLLEQASRELCALYGLNALTITGTHPESQLCRIEHEELLQLFVRCDSMTRGSLAGAKWSWEGSTLTVQLLANGKAALDECVPKVRTALSQRFDTPVEILIEAGQVLEGQALFDAMEKMRQNTMPVAGDNVAVPKKAEPVISDVLYGKAVRGINTPMKDVDMDTGSVTVEGRVFAVNNRELKKRNAWIVSFDMTDHTGSVRVKRFMENKEAAPFLERVDVGTVLRVQGKMTVDKFDSELVLQPYSVMLGSMQKRKDLAQGEKRVELHLHTTMSNMDALTDTADAVKQAAAWGHRAIAITDHGVAHSFPDAMKAASKAKVAGTDENIKILYGVEGYYINDVDGRIVVRGDAHMDFDGEYVAFDLETTGLSPEYDRIIEIGAVVMQRGQEIDRYQSFVDPKRKLPQEIIDLTGITDAMLQGAPEIEEALAQFLKFVNGRPLVAHNAAFDTSMLQAECARQGVVYDLTSVDTLILAQQLMPDLNRYKLNFVAKALALPDFKHHRAADDALTCGLVMAKFLPMLEKMGMDDIQSINGKLTSAFSNGIVLARQPRHIILLAKNQMGLRNLYHLISDANLEHFKRVPRIPKSKITELREGLIVGSACEAGELFTAITEGQNDEKLKEIASFYDFLEIQPISNNRFMIESEEYSAACDEDLRN